MFYVYVLLLLCVCVSKYKYVNRKCKCGQMETVKSTDFQLSIHLVFFSRIIIIMIITNWLSE